MRVCTCVFVHDWLCAGGHTWCGVERGRMMGWWMDGCARTPPPLRTPLDKNASLSFLLLLLQLVLNLTAAFTSFERWSVCLGIEHQLDELRASVGLPPLPRTRHKLNLGESGDASGMRSLCGEQMLLHYCGARRARGVRAGRCDAAVDGSEDSASTCASPLPLVTTPTWDTARRL